MPFGAIAAIAGPIIGGMLSSDASQSAAQTQSDAARYAADLQNQRYQQTRRDLMPYMQMGPQALSNLEALMGFGPIGGMGGGYGTAAIADPAAMQTPTAGGMPAAGTQFASPTGQTFTMPQNYSPAIAGKMASGFFGGPGGGLQFDPVTGQAFTSTPGAPSASGGAPMMGTRTALQQVGAVPTAAQGGAAGAGGAGAGGMALGGFSRDAMMQALQANPAYQFNLQQGMDAINKASAARGMYYAPATLQGLGSYAQGMASQEYGNIWNRLFNMAGMGQNAATQTGQFGANAATNMGNMAMQGANAQAAGIMGQNQAYQGIIGGVTGALNNPNTSAWLNSLYGGGSSGMGTGWDSASLGSFYP